MSKSSFRESLFKMSLSARIYLFVFLALVSVLMITMQASFISRQNLEASKEKELLHMSEIGVSLVRSFYDLAQQGEMSEEAAKNAAMRSLEKLRFDGNGYFTATNYDVVAMAHGAKPSLVGKNFSNVKDSNGVYFVREQARIAKEEGRGLVKYLWPRPGSDEPIEKMQYSLAFAPWEMAIGTGVYIDDVEATYWSNIRSLLTSSALIVFVIGAISIGIALSIVRPMNSITASMNELSKGNLDVKVHYKERSDEIGDMSRALRVFRNNAQERASLSEEQIRQKSEYEAQQRKSLLDMADQFDDQVRGILDGVAHSVANLSDETDSLANRARENTERVAMISKAMDASTHNVSNVAGASEEMTVSLTEIATQVDLSSNVSKTAVDEVKKATEVVATLEGASQAIGQIVSLIQDIAEQTNLLALNATIEAARAGEAGKGFAVVASEVKELASQTGKATDEISSQINSIQSNISNAVEVIGHVESTIDKISGISSAIAAAVEEQGVASGEISTNIIQAASGSREVSENAEALNVLSGENGQSAELMSQNAHDLNNQFKQLFQQIDTFLSGIREQNADTNARAA